MKIDQFNVNLDDKTCDQCKYGNPISEGDLYCDLFKEIRESYMWFACQSGFKEE